MKLSYDEIVTSHEKRDEKYNITYIEKSSPSKDKLIVLIATHNSHGKYTSLESLFNSDHDYDFLFLNSVDNSYYHRNDSGKSYQDFLFNYLKGYDPAKVVFFGSSMAGYCALRWSLAFNANCVVSNPQINLDESINYAWLELKTNIIKIPNRFNIDSVNYPGKETCIVSMFGHHPMDVRSFDRMISLVKGNTGLSLTIDQSDDINHDYLIKGMDHFMVLIERVLLMRQTKIKSWIKPA